MARKKKVAAQQAARRGVAARSSPAPKGTVEALRRQIDRIDEEIVEKLNERAAVAWEVGRLKNDAGQSVYAPKREQEVIDRTIRLSAGPLRDECIRAVFRELISGSRAVEEPLRVAFLGPEFSFSHIASIHRFGQSAELVGVATIAAVFDEVQRGQARYGVVPVENSTDGRVSDTLEMFAETRVKICGEVPLRVHHCLLGSGSRSGVREVASKPQALSQCRNWIAKHLPDARTVEVASTAAAARRAQRSQTTAAIASYQAGVNHQLDVLARNIEDNPGNLTRFAVIGSAPADRTGTDKTSLVFEIPHRAGALADVTAIFKRQQLNMTWIESYPIRGATGRYLFFIEFLGHQDDLRARRAIQALAKKAVRLEVLGSYARMQPIE
ncbi:MAG: prephenate dehydratase [Planctomycetia bacterium]|nr:MAG: prephenate dehydratase [Planctomycetia bacterium]